MPESIDAVWLLAGAAGAALVGGLLGQPPAFIREPAAPRVRVGRLGFFAKDLPTKVGRGASADAERGLVEAAGVLAERLRSGASLDEAFSLAGSEVSGPVGRAFVRLRDRLDLGTPFDVALAAWADEFPTPEARLLAAMVGLHRRTGGSLARTVEELGGALRHRIEAEADLRALTAQARLSAWIVGLLPIGFLAFLLLLSGPDLVAVFRTPTGALCLLLGVGLEGAGALWVRRILKVRR